MRLSAAVIAYLMLVTGCSGGGDTLREFKGVAMTVPYRILVDLPSDADEAPIAKVLATTFEEINAVYNKWNPNSELSLLNGTGTAPFILSAPLANFLARTEVWVKATDGMFDPTIEAVQAVWKQSLSEGHLPDSQALAEAQAVTGWHNLSMDGYAIRKKRPQVRLDLGGIVKGYTVDLLAERLKAIGYDNTYVEWGGEIRASGRHPAGRPWKIYISRPGDANPEKALAMIELDNCAVATSGDYLQQWNVEGQTFFHVIDPRSGRPLTAGRSTIASVTVMAPTCMEADVLATAAMLQGTVNEAALWAERWPNATFWIYSRETLPKAAY